MKSMAEEFPPLPSRFGVIADFPVVAVFVGVSLVDLVFCVLVSYVFFMFLCFILQCFLLFCCCHY